MADESPTAPLIDWERVAREPEFEIGPTRFRVHKLDMRRGIEVFDAFREAMTGRLAVALMARQPKLDQIMGTFFTLPSQYIMGLADDLFARVEYTRDGVTAPLDEVGLEKAFEGVPHTRFYEVVARAFVLNFSESLSDVASLFRKRLDSLSRPSGPKTSTP